MVTELADRGRWYALDSINAAQNFALGARTCQGKVEMSGFGKSAPHFPDPTGPNKGCYRH